MRSGNLVSYGGSIYYKRVRQGYYVLHPVRMGSVDYDVSIKEHRLVYELTHGVRLSNDVAIHHKNHDKLDNSPDNLVAMSFEDHAILHAVEDGKHVGPRLCVDCGREITNKATRCPECYRASTRACGHPTRDELADMIMTMNNTEIAELCGVSDRAVGKWRKQYGLPSASEQRRRRK